jgi:hypothetical protein
VATISMDPTEEPLGRVPARRMVRKVGEVVVVHPHNSPISLGLQLPAREVVVPPPKRPDHKLLPQLQLIHNQVLLMPMTIHFARRKIFV